MAENLALMTFPIQPRETILCSSYPDRPRISLDTFDAIKELEDRTRKIDWLVQSSKYLRRGFLRCGIERTSLAERQSVTKQLKRALWICTDLADIEACELSRREKETYDTARQQKLDCQHGMGSMPAETGYDSDDGDNVETELSMIATVITHGHRTPHVHQDGTLHGPGPHPSSETLANADHSPSRAVRQAQLDVIKELPTEDLAALFVLMSLSTRGFEDYLGGTRMASYPHGLITEWTVAVSENTVRHGVFFLYPQALRGNPSPDGRASSNDTNICLGPSTPALPPSTPRGPRTMCTHSSAMIGRHRRNARSVGSASPLPKSAATEEIPCCKSCSRHMAATAAAMVCQVVEELQAWESGEDQNLLPGLGMTVRGTLRTRLGCADDQLTANAALILKGYEPRISAAN